MVIRRVVHFMVRCILSSCAPTFCVARDDIDHSDRRDSQAESTGAWNNPQDSYLDHGVHAQIPAVQALVERVSYDRATGDVAILLRQKHEKLHG
jgi:hypothetical protein